MNTSVLSINFKFISILPAKMVEATAKKFPTLEIILAFTPIPVLGERAAFRAIRYFTETHPSDFVSAHEIISGNKGNETRNSGISSDVILSRLAVYSVWGYTLYSLYQNLS